MTSKQTILAALSTLVLAAGVASTSQAADLERGEVIAYSCLGCHGIDGYRNAYPSFRVPKLGGQKETYLAIALRGYRDDTRAHTTMNAQGKALSDEDIDDVAAYLATLGAETVAAGGTDGASFDKAQACAACHGQNGISLSPSWPTLAGQHQDYLEHALKQYRDGGRKDPVMMPLAAALSDDDIAQLAAYFAGLEGLETTEVAE